MIEKNKDPIETSLRQYVDNPYSGSSFLASRKLIKHGSKFVLANKH